MFDNPDGARLLRSTNWIFKCSSRSSSSIGGGECPFVPVGTQHIRKASPSASATRQPQPRSMFSRIFLLPQKRNL
jgi:hypothetical protein